MLTCSLLLTLGKFIKILIKKALIFYSMN
jgi:HECT-domain (ubiquitin-transferase)